MNDTGLVVCDHAFIGCRDRGCKHAVLHQAGHLPYLNGLDLGLCTDERNEVVCCVATGSPRRVHCVASRKDG